MIDSHDPIPFTPVPVRARHDGWTPERQRRFIDLLALTGIVAAAARGVGLTAKSARALRERADATEFAAAWDIARQMAGDRVYEIAVDRALHGIEVPRFYRGQQVGTARRFDYRLAFRVLDQQMKELASPPMSLEEALDAIDRE